MKRWNMAWSTAPWKRSGLRSLFAVLAFSGAMAATGCGRQGMPSERAVYEVARAALIEQAVFPESAPFPAFADCGIFVAKNAARVDVPLPAQFAPDTAAPLLATVWSKRMARTWELDRVSLPRSISGSIE